MTQYQALFLASPTDYRKYWLGKYQLKLFKLAQAQGDKGITTRELAETAGIKPGNASHHLSKIYKRGYLRREQFRDTTGRLFFRYWAVL